MSESPKEVTRTQQVMKVTAEVAVASGRMVWQNLLVLVMVLLFLGIGISCFLSAGPLGKVVIAVIGVATLVIIWYFCRPQEDMTEHWSAEKEWYTRD